MTDARETGSSSRERFRVLFVEDDKDDWARYMSAHSRRGGRFQFDFAYNVREADKKLAERHFHFVSIDQSLPESEGEKPIETHGLDLCEDVVHNHPLTYRAIYTLFGKAEWANRAGRLNGTPYYEKGSGSTADNLSVADYITKLNAVLYEEYFTWALDHAEMHLPMF